MLILPVISQFQSGVQHSAMTLFKRMANTNEMELLPGFGVFRLSFQAFYNRLIGSSTSIAIMVAIVLVSSAGYMMMVNGGNTEKIKAAKEQIQDAILGLLLVLMAVTIVRIIFAQVLPANTNPGIT